MQLTKNVGGSLIEMCPSDTFRIESSNTIVVFTCTALGLPISGSYVLIFSIIGSGLSKGEKPNWKPIKKNDFGVDYYISSSSDSFCFSLFSYYFILLIYKNPVSMPNYVKNVEKFDYNWPKITHVGGFEPTRA